MEIIVKDEEYFGPRKLYIGEPELERDGMGYAVAIAEIDGVWHPACWGNTQGAFVRVNMSQSFANKEKATNWFSHMKKKSSDDWYFQ